MEELPSTNDSILVRISSIEEDKLDVGIDDNVDILLPQSPLDEDSARHQMKIVAVRYESFEEY